MPLHACPADVFRTAPSRVWDALTLPREMEKWIELRILNGPARAVEAGDRLVLVGALGRAIKVYFDIKKAEPPVRLALDVTLPLGIVNHEVIQITAMGPDRCRVTFN